MKYSELSIDQGTDNLCLCLLQLSTEQIGTDQGTDNLCLYLLQLSTEQIGTLPGPVLPSNVTGELDLTQSLTGGLDNGTAATRGYTTSAPGTPYFSNDSQVE